MSELSEEKIIDNAEKLTYEVIVEDDLHNWDNMSPNEIATIMKGLLDLYQKEKEKNKKLEDADLTTVYMNGFYDGEKKWKDKINGLLKEIDDNNTDEGWWYINKIEELLEERN